MKLTETTKKIVNKQWVHGNHKISWGLFNVKGKFDITKRRTKEINRFDICYSGLTRFIKDEFHTHLVTDIELDNYPKRTLSEKEMMDWIILSKKNKTLPYYLSAKNIIDNKVSLNATFKLRSVPNFPVLFIYLATLIYKTF